MFALGCLIDILLWFVCVLEPLISAIMRPRRRHGPEGDEPTIRKLQGPGRRD